MSHGAYSPRRVDPLAAKLVELMLADPGCGHLQRSSYRPALWAWARAEARVQLLDEWLSTKTFEQQMEPPVRGTIPPLEVLRKWESTAASHRARLGLDPLSRARLGKDVAVGALDTARLMAALERAECDDREGDAG